MIDVINNIKDIYVGTVGIKNAYLGTELVYKKSGVTPSLPNYLRFTAVTAGSTVKLYTSGSPASHSFEYKEGDNGIWSDYTLDTDITLTNEGDYVQFRRKSETPTTAISRDYNNCYRFGMSGSISASGDIMSLLDKKLNSTTVGANGLIRLFYYCSSLNYTNELQLSATNVGDRGYFQMFMGSGIILSPLILPATTLSNYAYMDLFTSCSNMITAPYICATTFSSGSLTQIFKGCTKVTSHHVASLNASIDMFQTNRACTTFIIDAVTPPTISSSTITGLKSDCIVYVPDESVQAYKDAQYWSARANYIKGISEKPTI